MYNEGSTASYTITFQQSEISSEAPVFYVPMVIRDSQQPPNVLSNIDFYIGSERLTVNSSEHSGVLVFQVPITLNNIRSSTIRDGNVVVIPMVINVPLDQETLHVLNFNLRVHTTGRLTISPDSINWTFSGDWSNCSSDIELSYSGVLDMDVSITSEHNFCMVSSNSTDSISYSVYNSRLVGSKELGYKVKVTDNSPIAIQVSADSGNSTFVKAGYYSDTITIQLMPAV